MSCFHVKIEFRVNSIKDNAMSTVLIGSALEYIDTTINTKLFI